LAKARQIGELYLRAYAEMYGLSPICLALANVYGPRQNPHGIAGEVAVLASAMITGNPYAMYRDDTAARDYVYVDDVVDAFVQAADAPLETTGTYNVGTGQPATVTEVYGHIASALDAAPPVAAAIGTDDVRALALNAAKAGKDLDWIPKVNLAEGIRRTVRWLCATLEPETPALTTA
jgi:UDP-glucose 4-epimerase